MGDLLEELMKLMPPPEHNPQRVDNPDWAGAEAELGFRLPHDYKAFIERYGPGEVGEYFIYSPIRPSPITISGWSLNLIDFIEATGWAQNSARDWEIQLGWSEPNIQLAYYPRQDGLIPWAGFDANYLTWKPEGDPDDWKVVVDGVDIEAVELGVGFVEFWYRLLTDGIASEQVWPVGSGDKDELYKPYRLG